VIDMGAALVMEEDPVCDAVQAICGGCHFRYECDYLFSGCVELCSTIIAEMGDEYPTGSNLDERLEKCFEKMIQNTKPRARRI
jgi:hypothetical protein